MSTDTASRPFSVSEQFRHNSEELRYNAVALREYVQGKGEIVKVIAPLFFGPNKDLAQEDREAAFESSIRDLRDMFAKASAVATTDRSITFSTRGDGSRTANSYQVLNAFLNGTAVDKKHVVAALK